MKVRQRYTEDYIKMRMKRLLFVGVNKGLRLVHILSPEGCWVGSVDGCADGCMDGTNEGCALGW